MGIMIRATLYTALILILTAGMIDTFSEHKEIKVNCYDEFHNKIDNISCSKMVIINDNARLAYRLFLGFGISAIIWMPCLLIFIDGLLNNLEKKK